MENAGDRKYHVAHRGRKVGPLSLAELRAEVLRRALAEAGLTGVAVETVETPRELPVTPDLIARWFDASAGDRPSYGQRLGRVLDADTLADVRAVFARELVGKTVSWRSVVAFVGGHRER